METTSYVEPEALATLTGRPDHLARPAAAGRCSNAPDPRTPREDYRYSWLEDHLSRLEGKELRSEYYARLE